MKLKRFIIYLNTILSLKNNKQNKLNKKYLEKLILYKDKWELLEKLCNLFNYFDNIIIYFSSVKYWSK